MLRYGPHLTGVRLPGQGHGPGQLAVSFDISPAWSAHRGLIGLWKLKELRFRGRGFKVGQAFPGTDPPRCYVLLSLLYTMSRQCQWTVRAELLAACAAQGNKGR